MKLVVRRLADSSLLIVKIRDGERCLTIFSRIGGEIFYYKRRWRINKERVYDSILFNFGDEG
jgi:hypothetical protein